MPRTSGTSQPTSKPRSEVEVVTSDDEAGRYSPNNRRSGGNRRRSRSRSTPPTPTPVSRAKRVQSPADTAARSSRKSAQSTQPPKTMEQRRQEACEEERRRAAAESIQDKREEARRRPAVAAPAQDERDETRRRPTVAAPAQDERDETRRRPTVAAAQDVPKEREGSPSKSELKEMIQSLAVQFQQSQQAYAAAAAAAAAPVDDTPPEQTAASFYLNPEFSGVQLPIAPGSRPRVRTDSLAPPLHPDHQIELMTEQQKRIEEHVWTALRIIRDYLEVTQETNSSDASNLHFLPMDESLVAHAVAASNFLELTFILETSSDAKLTDINGMRHLATANPPAYLYYSNMISRDGAVWGPRTIPAGKTFRNAVTDLMDQDQLVFALYRPRLERLLAEMEFQYRTPVEELEQYFERQNFTYTKKRAPYAVKTMRIQKQAFERNTSVPRNENAPRKAAPAAGRPAPAASVRPAVSPRKKQTPTGPNETAAAAQQPQDAADTQQNEQQPANRQQEKRKRAGNGFRSKGKKSRSHSAPRKSK